MAAANGAEERTTHVNTLIEKISTTTNEEYIDKEHIILQDISHIITNKNITSPVTTNRSQQETIETDWMLIHTPKQSTSTSQYQHNMDKAYRSQS